MKPVPIKRKYDVYIVGKGTGVYAEDYCREYVGSTMATSPAKACNNVRFQTRNQKHPHGGYATECIGDYLDEGYVKFCYEAVLADEN